MQKNDIGWRKITLGLIISLLFIGTYVYAPPIFISVSGKIQGSVDYLNYSSEIYKAPQIIYMNIENTGSAGCAVKVRADFYKDSRLLKTTWSEIEALEPGGHFLFHNYWMPDREGNITANITIHQCYETFERDQISFYVSNSTIGRTDNLQVIEAKNTKSEINLTIVSNKTLEDVLVIPANYPLGWLVEPVKINKIEKDEEKTITVPYVPSTWHGETILFDIITQDGTEYTTHSVQLKEQEHKKELISKNTIILILLAVIILLSIEILRLRKKRNKTKDYETPAKSYTYKAPENKKGH